LWVLFAWDLCGWCVGCPGRALLFGGDVVEDGFDEPVVVPVRVGQVDVQREPVPGGQDVIRGAELSPVRGRRSSEIAPLLARTQNPAADNCGASASASASRSPCSPQASEEWPTSGSDDSRSEPARTPNHAPSSRTPNTSTPRALDGNGRIRPRGTSPAWAKRCYLYASSRSRKKRDRFVSLSASSQRA